MRKKINIALLLGMIFFLSASSLESNSVSLDKENSPAAENQQEETE